MRTIFFFLFLLLACSCEKQSASSQFEQEDRVINAFDIAVGEELGLSFRGIGGRSNEKIEEIGISYYVKGQATADEARALCIYVTEKLLKFINEDEGIRPHLQEYPFPASRINLQLFFRDAYTYPISNTRVYRISNCFDFLDIRHYQAFQKHYSNEQKELYSTAKEHLEKNPIPIPIVHKNTPLEDAMDAVLPKYREDMYEQYGLWTSSIGCDRGKNPQELGTVFTFFKPATQDEARELVVTATETLLERISKYPAFDSIDANKIAMRIEFRNAQYFPYYGTLDNVTLEKGKLSYADDEDLIREESYQEAVNKFTTREPAAQVANSGIFS